MKRFPKSFDASMKQVPKHLVLGGQDLLDEEDESLEVIIEEHDSSSRIGEDLSVNLNRLQVSTASNSSASNLEDLGMHSSSSHNSEDMMMMMDVKQSSTRKPTHSGRRVSSRTKQARRVESELLASLNTAASSTMQEEEERSFTRCLDSGIRSANLTGFFFARDDEQKQFTVFRIEIVTVAQTWVVFRRYSDFVSLATNLQALSPTNFPPKTPFGGNFAKDFLQKRQIALSSWLNKALMTSGVVTMPDVRSFLVSQANVVPSLVESDDDRKKSSTSSGASSRHSSSELPATNTIHLEDPVLMQTPKKKEMSISSQVTVSGTGADTPPASALKEASPSGGARSNFKSPYAPNSRKVSLGDFELLRVLGKGSFGKVVLAAKRTGRDAHMLYAMKILNKQNVVSKKQVEHTLTERSVLGKMNHPFIVKLHYAFQTEKKLHFVLDYCPGGELFIHLGQAGQFTEHQSRFYAAEMTLALGHLHTHGVVYRDLKPENILFEANGHLKLADFGLSKEGVESTQGSHSFCGTPEYLAPEILNRTGHGTAVDWWSLGALLYEMLTGLPPWFSQDRQQLFLGIRQAPLQFPPVVSPLARSILGEFLKREPDQRLGSGGVEQVKQHPFFASMDWVALYELRLPPPFIPHLTSQLDTRNFDQQFTRLPVQSEATSPPQVMIAASPASTVQVVLPQRALVNGNPGLKKSLADDMFGGFTYQEDLGWATPPTPYSVGGLCTPPPIASSKRQSPLRPGPTVYHPRPSSGAASSMSRTPVNSFLPASSPTVSG